MSEIEMYLVGGFVRDHLLGVRSKDIDFTVVAPSWEAMRAHLIQEGFNIHLESPEYVTVRAGVPEGHEFRQMARDADFVLARRDGPSSDGRRPDHVEPGTLLDDLARRDFTVNAIAMAHDGSLLDPHGGQEDLEARRLQFVGDPLVRIQEDGLRVLRGFRFMITKGLTPTVQTLEALTSPEATEMLGAVSLERIREELNRMFHHDTLETLLLFRSLPSPMRDAIFRPPLRLTATLAQ